MLRLSRPIMSVAQALLAMSMIAGCGQPYSSEPIAATVTDATTDLPIPDVNVVAYWDRYGGLEGGVYEGNVNVVETTTDQSGAFFIPGWGPKWATGIVKRQNPKFIFFKSGYSVKFESNDDNRIGEWTMGMFDWTTTMRSDLNNTKVRLKAIGFGEAGNARDIESLSDRLGVIGLDFGAPCDWKKFTRMIISVEREYRMLKRLGVLKPRSRSIYDRLLENNSPVSKQCSASPMELLRSIE